MTYCFIGVYAFSDGSKLTPLFYTSNLSSFYFYFTFLQGFDNSGAACHKAIDYSSKQDADCICNTISTDKVFALNTLLNFFLIVGLIHNIVGIYIKYWILRGIYFRWTVSNSLYTFLIPFILLLEPLYPGSDYGLYHCPNNLVYFQRWRELVYRLWILSDFCADHGVLAARLLRLGSLLCQQTRICKDSEGVSRG